MDEIDPETLQTLLDDDAAVRIVDIRSPAAFEDGHIPGSENVPFEELPDAVEQFDGAERVVTVCPHGEASLQAARLLSAYEGLADATVESLAGGVTAWDGELSAGGDRTAPF
jgi:rhodanese-related sulfurtransferase